MKLSAYYDADSVLRDAEFFVTGASNSSASGTLTFACTEAHLAIALSNSNVVSVVVPEALLPRCLETDLGVVISPNPRESFFLTHNKIARNQLLDQPPSISATASVATSAVISPNASIGRGAVISDFAFVGPGTIIGEDAFVGERAVIGVAGHFEQWAAGHRIRVEHVGTVIVGTRSQILAGAIVQRDVFMVHTHIGDDAVIGPGVLVGHGVEIGSGSVLTGGVTVAGYTTIGDNVWIGPGSTIGNKLQIGDGARIEIGSVVVTSLGRQERVSGNFAIRHNRHIRSWRKIQG